MTRVENFWSKVDKTGDCWLWTGATDGRYGSVHWVTARLVKAHRVSWELINGPIPEGMDLCHHCDNPPCVRPEHLFIGTRSENMFDASRKKRLPGSRATHCKRGHEFTEENTKRRANGRRSCRACLRESAKAHEARRAPRKHVRARGKP